MSPMETPEICLMYPWETHPQFAMLLASTDVGETRFVCGGVTYREVAAVAPRSNGLV
jgi:hypothetical protein